MTSNPEIAALQRQQKTLAGELEALNSQLMLKRETYLKYQGVIEYLSSKESQDEEPPSKEAPEQ